VAAELRSYLVSMGTYIARRIVLILPTIVLTGTLVFFIARMVPGSPVDAIIGENALSNQDRQALSEALGLDKPLPVAYVDWWGQTLSGNLGKSVITSTTVDAELRHRLPVSLELGLLGIGFSVLIGIPIGLIAAVKQDSPIDYILRSISIGFLSIPGFWIAILVIAIMATEFHVAPNFRYIPLSDDPIGNLKQFVTPALIIGLASSAAIMRMMRATMLDVVRQDYMQTARAKGLRARNVIFIHGLPNALIPVITIIGLNLATIVGGLVIFEQIYNLPGMGPYVLTAIEQRDYPVIQGVNLLIAFSIIFVNFMVDISYGALDPRIRYG